MTIVVAAAAVTHGSFVAFMVGGGPASRRRPNLRRLHHAAIAASAAVFLTRSACPLTTMENAARRAAGVPTIDGFVEHYIVRPLHPSGITPAVRGAIFASWLVPTLAAYLTPPRRRFVSSR